MTTPPRLARAILRLALPDHQRDAVLGDLDDEYRQHVRPSRTACGARVWYWRQVLSSLAPSLAMRRRRRQLDVLAPRASGVGRTRRSIQIVGQDLRLAVRSLVQRPGFAAVAIVTIALGMGVNSAIFSIVDAVLLRPLPYAEPSRLVRVWSANPRGIARNSVSPPDFADLRAQAVNSFGLEGLAAFTTGDASTLNGIGDAQRLASSTVSPELFELLGVRAVQGRALIADDASGDAVIVISERLWRSVLGASSAVIGTTLTVDGAPATVVGVLPPSFEFPSRDVDLWMPLSHDELTRSRSAHYLDVVGRLAPGVSMAAATDALQTVAARLAVQYPDTNRGWGVTVVSLQDSVVGDVRTPLLVLGAAVGCVLLIACANVAALLLARGTGRARELAVRVALGASRGRIVSQQLTESIVVALAGGAAGLAIAHGILEALPAAAGFDLPRSSEIRLDYRVLAVTAAASVITGLLCGLVPAWRASRATADDALKTSRTIGSAGRRIRSTLVAMEIALTVALLIVAGLLIRSFERLTNVEAGFKADRVLLAQVSLPGSRSRPAEWASFFDRAVSEIRVLPGVVAAGAGAPLPLSGQQGLLRFGLRIDGRPEPADGRLDRVYLRWATPDYFKAIGILLLRGRAFADSDRADTLPVAVIDETLAARHFPNEDPIGRRVRSSNDRTWRQIVGVVGAVRQSRLEDPAEPHLYVVEAQSPSPAMTFVVRTAGDPRMAAGAVRDTIRRIDPAQPVFNIRTLDDVVSGAVAARRFNALLLVLFALLAVALTVVGIYGVVNYWVSESRREIGVRMALGASRAEVVRMVLGRTVRVTALGALGGAVLALGGTEVVAKLLYGTTPTDPVAFATGIGLAFVVALVASLVPARRALAVDPAESLRAE